jgi:hypothetical protein
MQTQAKWENRSNSPANRARTGFRRVFGQCPAKNKKRRTSLAAIMEAGGFTAYTGPKKVSVIPQLQGDRHTQVVDLSPVLRGCRRLHYMSAPGDVICVRPKFISF